VVATALQPTFPSHAQSVRGLSLGVVSKLQLAASNVVRETSYADKDGSQRTYALFSKLFNADKAQLKKAATVQEGQIQRSFNEVGGAINGPAHMTGNGFG